MSVSKEADDNLCTARNAVDVAIQSLARIVVLQCEGSDDYNSAFTKHMRDSLNELIDIRESLK